MTTIIGTFTTKFAAQREGLSIKADAPADVTIELRINDNGTWSVVEVS